MQIYMHCSAQDIQSGGWILTCIQCCLSSIYLILSQQQSWAIVKYLTITIFNRYLNDSEYYRDSETKIWIQILSISTCGRETKYSDTPLLEPSNRKTSSSLSRSISFEIFLAIFSCHMVVGMLRQDNVQCTCL